MTVSRLFLCAKRSLRQELLTARRQPINLQFARERGEPRNFKMKFQFLAKETGGCDAQAGPNKLSIAGSVKSNGSLNLKLVLEKDFEIETFWCELRCWPQLRLLARLHIYVY